MEPETVCHTLFADSSVIQGNSLREDVYVTGNCFYKSSNTIFPYSGKQISNAGIMNTIPMRY